MKENLLPAIHLYEGLFPFWKDRHSGHFVHVSSSALDFYSSKEVDYCTSKAALEAMVLSISQESPAIKHHLARISLTDTPLARRVCPQITNWDLHYTAGETAAILLDIIEHPQQYPKPIVTPLYQPIR